ncbi:diguanylate cyclase [Rhodobacterales bacterium HKCCE2091]|nr:diguanylate cyclase [Rhodobacterales bacterium HKCCE2091]
MSRVDTILHRVIGLPGRGLDRLLPMHLWFGPSGAVNRAGPTLEKLAARGDLRGRDVFDVIDIRQPRAIDSLPALLAVEGAALGLRLTGLPDLPLRGQVHGLAGGSGGLLNISLGLSFAEAVEARGLTLSDFSPCDQTVELLYLREAILATTAETRRLTDRLLAARHAAEARATSDALTGLANRRGLAARLDELLLRPDAEFALMHIDLDYFKQVNDELGHAAGDEVLVRVAQILKSEVRDTDLAARIGGDEFVLLLSGCDEPSILSRIARRVMDKLSRPMEVEGSICQVGGSIGTTRSSLYADPDPDQMLRDADEALYASKRQGRGRHTLFRPPGLDAARGLP